MKSEIEFVLNGTCRCETTVYLHMKSISGETKPICKFVLSENCVTHYSNCNCAAAVVDSRHGYKMWRKFHPQDSGDWVFEVWGTNVQTIISIRVKGEGLIWQPFHFSFFHFFFRVDEVMGDSCVNSKKPRYAHNRKSSNNWNTWTNIKKTLVDDQKYKYWGNFKMNLKNQLINFCFKEEQGNGHSYEHCFAI